MSTTAAGIVVHIDDLVGGETVASAQGSHLSTMDRYVRDHLSRTHAFGGVMGLFRAQYSAALEAAHGGLRAGAGGADAVAAGFGTCRREFVEADRSASTALDRMTQTVRIAGERKLAAEVAELRGHPGPWGHVVPLHDALSGLRDAGSGVRDAGGDLVEEAQELRDTSADLRSYVEFVSGAGR